MPYNYDENNIFAKILRGEIPHKSAGENSVALAFYDINPAAPLHVLVIPKGAYVNYDDFLAQASMEEKQGFDELMLKIIRDLELTSETGEKGYRVISNSGAWGMQEVPHYHVHILAGEAIGPLRVK